MRGSAIALALLLALPAAAAPADLDPAAIAGVYKHRFSNGTVFGDKYRSEDILEIVPWARHTAYVRTHLEFFNGHSCDMSGMAVSRDGALVYDLHVNDDGQRCVLSLTAADGKLVFHDPGGICRAYYCGARGSLDGTSFDRSARRPIRYLSRLRTSQDYRDAEAEYEAAQHR